MVLPQTVFTYHLHRAKLQVLLKEKELYCLDFQLRSKLSIGAGEKDVQSK